MVRRGPKRHTRCVCGATYGETRTGLTFAGVIRMMKTNDPGAYRQIRRRGVLGFWREIKVAQWHQTHGGCDD